MPKNALFLEKAGKIVAVLGAPRCPPVAGGFAPKPPSVTPTRYKYDFRVVLKILGIVKITTYYLIVTVSGLPSQALPPPGSNL